MFEKKIIEMETMKAHPRETNSENNKLSNTDPIIRKKQIDYFGFAQDNPPENYDPTLPNSDFVILLRRVPLAVRQL